MNDSSHDDADRREPPAQSPAPAEKPASAVGGEDLELLRKKAAERDELWQRLLRTHADFENWRKRIERDSRTSVRFAVQEFVQEMLPVIDNFERAITAAEEGESVEPFLEGMRLVRKQLYDVLRANDVVALQTVGEKFDPEAHEAVSVIPTDKQPPFTVLHELNKGFRMHDRVIRPAQVVVAASPAQDGPATGAEATNRDEDEK